MTPQQRTAAVQELIGWFGEHKIGMADQWMMCVDIVARNIALSQCDSLHVVEGAKEAGDQVLKAAVKKYSGINSN